MSGWRLVGAVVATVLIVWQLRSCAPPEPLYPIREPQPPAADLASAYDPGRCGTIRGRVEWTGTPPTVPPIRLIQVRNPPAGVTDVPNPNAPRIRDHGFGGALVYLTGVDLARSGPWHLAAVTVEVRRTGLAVLPAGQGGDIGIVRRGEPVEMVSREAGLHSIRGRGAEFFTQMLPVPDCPVRRVMSSPGIVELSSGSGCYWLRGYLFVTDHPYAVATGPDGSFQFDSVPDGAYEAFCWVPNWRIDRTETDPEWLGPVRLYFEPAVERRQRVTVRRGITAELRFALSAEDFTPGSSPPTR